MSPKMQTSSPSAPKRSTRWCSWTSYTSASRSLSRLVPGFLRKLSPARVFAAATKAPWSGRAKATTYRPPTPYPHPQPHPMAVDDESVQQAAAPKVRFHLAQAETSQQRKRRVSGLFSLSNVVEGPATRSKPAQQPSTPYPIAGVADGEDSESDAEETTEALLEAEFTPQASDGDDDSEGDSDSNSDRNSDALQPARRGRVRFPIETPLPRYHFRGLSPSRPSTHDRLGPSYLWYRQGSYLAHINPSKDHVHKFLYTGEKLFNVLDLKRSLHDEHYFCVAKGVSLPSDPSRFPGLVHAEHRVPQLRYRPLDEDDENLPTWSRLHAHGHKLWTSCTTPPMNLEDFFEPMPTRKDGDKWPEHLYSRPIDAIEVERGIWEKLGHLVGVDRDGDCDHRPGARIKK